MVSGLVTNWAIAVAFALLAWRMRGVSRSGAVAGVLICFLIESAFGLHGFLLLLWLFLLTWLATRAGFSRKQTRGLAEQGTGRTASQVVANLGVATLAGIAGLVVGAWPAPVLFLNGIHGGPFAVAFVAAMAEAAADTVASELGQLAGNHAFSILGLQRVPHGTNGGITAWGTLAGAVASVLVGLAAFALGILPLSAALCASGAGFAGMLVDSVLGATVEQRGWLGNDWVNFLSTAAAAGMAVVGCR